MSSQCDPKMAAAKGALELILSRDIELLGIGTGSTVERFISLLPRDIVSKIEGFVPTSRDTARKLFERGFRRILDSTVLGSGLDAYIDGADEVDPRGRLVKGRGGALLGEKLVAFSSKYNVIIVDESKIVEILGSKKPLPVEVVPEGLEVVLRVFRDKGLRYSVRPCNCKDGPAVSDWRGILVDLYTGPLKDPEQFDQELHLIPGVVETGLFIDLTDVVVIGLKDCSWKVWFFDRVRRAK